MRSSLMATEIAEPYAQALMSYAKDHDATDRIGEDVSGLLGLLKESEDLRLLLATPLVEADRKKAVLRQIAGDQLHPFTLNFLMFLVDRGRISFLKDIGQEYQSLLRQLNQAVLATVISAVELNDDQKEAIRQKVLSITQARQVDLETQLDPELLGGVIIKVGSQVIDASLRGQLRRIGMRLASAT